MNFVSRCKMYLLIKYETLLRKFKIANVFPVHYIGGSEALPPPLTLDEETYLLNKLEQSDYGV